MIKNVVFDLGQVLIAYEPMKYLSKLGFDETKASEINKAIFSDKLWHELDRGTYTFAEAIEAYKTRRPDLEKEIERVFHKGWLDDIFSEKEDSVEFMKALLQEGYNVYFLSNFAAESYSYAEERFPFLHLPHGKIISYRENCIKPEPEIYEILLSRFNLVPEETVFFDDLAANVEAAKKLNINAIQFTGLKEAKEKFYILCHA